MASAQPPTFVRCPDGSMLDDMRQNYHTVSVMYFGEPLAFDAVIETIAALEAELNIQVHAEFVGTSYLPTALPSLLSGDLCRSE